MRLYPIGGLILLLAIVASGAEFSDAVAAFERGDNTSAESLLHQILKNTPGDAAALGLLGAVFDAEKKYSDADAVYRRALRVAPHSATLLNNFGNHQLATGDLVGARATYLKAIALDSSRANANLQLASIAVEEKHGPEALRYIEHLPPEDRSAPQVVILEMRALYLSSRNEEADAIAARLSSADDPRLTFTAGLALASSGKYQQAETFFNRVLQSDPGNFDVLYNLGLAAYHAGHWERAREVLQMAQVQRPRDIGTLVNLAGVDIDLKQREAALGLLVDAAHLDPSRADIQLNIAKTTSALGFYADSLIAYDKYLKLVPGDESARRERAFMDAVSSHPREGLAALQDFSRSHPVDAVAHYEVGILEARTEPASAATHLSKAIALQPDFVPARFGRGVLNFLQANPSAALPDFEFAAAHYPDNSPVLDRLGETYLALGRTGDAVITLRKASQYSPDDARVLMHLSRALSKAGDIEEAKAVLARFRSVGSQRGNLIPLPGFVDFLGLPPEELRARYRDEVEKRLKEQPDDPALNVRYLQLLIDEKKTDQVAALSARLLTLKPPAPLAAAAGRALLDIGRYAQAQPLLEYAARSGLNDEVRIDLAVALSHTAGAEQGLSQLDDVPATQRSIDYYLARAQILESSGKFDDALASINRALSPAPARADLYPRVQALAGRIDLDRREYNSAVQHLSEAIRLRPDYLQAHYTLGQVYTAMGRAEDAARQNIEVRRLRKDSPRMNESDELDNF